MPTPRWKQSQYAARSRGGSRARLARRVAEGGGAGKGEPGVVARRSEHRGGDGRRSRRPARGGVSRGVFDDEAPRRRAVYDM